MATMVTRSYGGFRGVDFRGDEINLLRSPDSVNMWRDYKDTDGVRTRPCMELVQTFQGVIYGIFFFKGKRIVHAGKKLFDGATEIFSDMNEAPSQSFVFGEVLYIKDGKNYLKYTGSGNATEVVGYVPTTTISRKPEGTGTVYQDVNMLSDYRIDLFVADGESVDYFLDAENIDNDYTPEVTVEGAVTPSFTVDYTKGKIVFSSAPAKPQTDGQSNVSIKYKKAVAGHRDKVMKSTLLQVFDNRVFFAGNPDEPNMVRHCSLYAPDYVSDTDYYEEGLDDAAIRGLVAGNNALWVMREPSDANTSIFYHVPSLDGNNVKIYPSSHSSVSIGCVGRAVNFNDDIVFFSERGMEGISGDITTEQVAAHRSTTVDTKLLKEQGYKDMTLVEWLGYLVVFIGSHAYLADSRTAFQVENHFEYDWFYWEMEHPVTAANVHDGVLYVGTENGLYTLTDTDAPLSSYWVTPKDKFDYPSMQKTTNKRGCVVEATGDVTVSAKTDKTAFEEISRHEDVTDHLVCRIKRKKFKDIQLKFSSDTRFSLESATLECFIGGYIKR